MSLCQQHNLFDAIIHIYNKAMLDYITPAEKLLVILSTCLANPPLTEQQVKLGNKLLVYISCCLAGRAYPWGDVPKFTLDMDAWKRFYSNNDEDKSIEHFWTLITPEVKEHYSLWKCNYKYNDELNMDFMASNLVGGMYQRIEKLRKHVSQLVTFQKKITVESV